MITIQAIAGTHLNYNVGRAFAISSEKQSPVQFDMNGIVVRVDYQKDTYESVLAEYERELSYRKLIETLGELGFKA